MLGGYNIQPLIDLLDSDDVADAAADALSSTLLMFDAFQMWSKNLLPTRTLSGS